MGKGTRGRGRARRGGGGGSTGVCGLMPKQVDENDPNRIPDEVGGLFSCFSDIGSCVDGFFCHLCFGGLLYDELMNSIKNPRTDDNSVCSKGTCYACFFLGGGPLLACHIRQNVYWRYSIGGEGDCGVCLAGCCCPQLSNCQMYRLLKHTNCPPGKVMCADDQHSRDAYPKPKIMNTGKAIWGAFTEEMHAEKFPPLNFNMMGAAIDPAAMQMILANMQAAGATPDQILLAMTAMQTAQQQPTMAIGGVAQPAATIQHQQVFVASPPYGQQPQQQPHYYNNNNNFQFYNNNNSSAPPPPPPPPPSNMPGFVTMENVQQQHSGY